MKQQNGTSPRIGRRRFLQIIAATGATGVLWQLGLRKKILRDRVVRQSRSLMGTQINLIVYGPDRDTSEKAINKTFSRMETLVGSLSRHNPESELSSLNRTGRLTNPGKDIQNVLQFSQQISELTGGSFDVTILPLYHLYKSRQKTDSLPTDNEIRDTLHLVDYRQISVNPTAIKLNRIGMGVTLDGIGKGYIVDQGIETLKSMGFDSVYVEAGGDLMVTGPKNSEEAWRIGIQNPRPESSDKMMVIGITHTAVATSGDYMQPFTKDLSYHHILDPHTGISPPELASATVTAPTVALADALATAAMVMGPERSLALLESMPGCEGLLIKKDLTRKQTSGFTS